MERAIIDLHAADAGYHADFLSRFMGSRAERAAQNIEEVSKLHSFTVLFSNVTLDI